MSRIQFPSAFPKLLRVRKEGNGVENVICEYQRTELQPLYKLLLNTAEEMDSDKHSELFITHVH